RFAKRYLYCRHPLASARTLRRGRAPWSDSRRAAPGSVARRPCVMINWIVRALLLLGGVVTSWFLAPDATNFSLVQAAVAISLLAFFVAVAVFLPALIRA